MKEKKGQNIDLDQDEISTHIEDYIHSNPSIVKNFGSAL